MSAKVTIIGAGAVGGTLAQRVLESGIADVVLLDIAKGLACGKALDLEDAAPTAGHERKITGTDDYKEIEGSDICVITAGFTRRPGMTREDLIGRNADIVRGVSLEVKAHSPDAVTIVVTNPLDVMTYLAYKTIGSRREKVFGMAGVLDGSRFIQQVADELKVPRSSVTTYMLGSHGDTMVPVLSKTPVSGKPVNELISKDRLEEIIKRTRQRGAEIVGLLGTGSASYSPSIAVFKMIEAILKDTAEVLVVTTYLEGEYGFEGICIGVPCRIGRDGIGEIIELDLSAEERKSFLKSADAIRDSIKSLPFLE